MLAFLPGKTSFVYELKSKNLLPAVVTRTAWIDTRVCLFIHERNKTDMTFKNKQQTKKQTSTETYEQTNK
jgi:hypothetical protein